MKIFIGTSEIAGMLTFISNAYRELGHEVITCSDNYGLGFYDNSYDIILNKEIFTAKSKNRYVNGVYRRVNDFWQSRLRERVFLQERDKHDVYIFMWNGFSQHSIDDYAYLRKKNKKIISLFLGSDVRHISAFAQEYKLDVSEWEQWFHTMDLNSQLFRLRKAEMFSDAIFSVPDQAGLAVRPYNHIYIPFNASSIRQHIPDNTIPKIVHIPSRSGIKGTKFIIGALDRLREEGLQFEFELISGVPNKVVLEKLQHADILVDEIFLHGPGTLSLEGIASGCAVATKTMPGGVYDDTAVCNIDFDNLYTKLRKLITDTEYRRGLIKRGRLVLEEVNSPLRVADRILQKAIEVPTSGGQCCDHSPRFFSDAFTLPSNVTLSERNKELTRQVLRQYDLYDKLNIERMRDNGLI